MDLCWCCGKQSSEAVTFLYYMVVSVAHLFFDLTWCCKQFWQNIVGFLIWYVDLCLGPACQKCSRCLHWGNTGTFLKKEVASVSGYCCCHMGN